MTEAEQRTVIDQHRVDLCFVRLPLEQEGLHLIPLYEEVPVVVVPRDHPASLFPEVSRDDLSDEDSLEGFEPGEAMDLVAGGAGVVFLPQSVARSLSRRDLVYRPVSDAQPTRIGLAWLRDNPDELIEEFIGIVRGRTVNSSRSSRPPSTPSSEPKSRSRSAKRTGRPRCR